MFFFENLGRDLLGEVVLSAITPTNQPGAALFIPRINIAENPFFGKAALNKLDDIFNLALGLRIKAPTGGRLQMLSLFEGLEFLGVDNVAGVLTDHNDSILIKHNLFRLTAKV